MERKAISTDPPDNPVLIDEDIPALQIKKPVRKAFNIGRVISTTIFGGLTAAGIGFTSAGIYEMSQIDLNSSNDPDVLNVSKIDERLARDTKGTQESVIGLGLLCGAAMLIRIENS
jgi:hypothetical protein